MICNTEGATAVSVQLLLAVLYLFCRIGMFQVQSLKTVLIPIIVKVYTVWIVKNSIGCS